MCYERKDETMGEKSKYVRVLIERDAVNEDVSICSQRHPGRSAIVDVLYTDREATQPR
jgi:hypothetical protein